MFVLKNKNHMKPISHIYYWGTYVPQGTIHVIKMMGSIPGLMENGGSFPPG